MQQNDVMIYFDGNFKGRIVGFFLLKWMKQDVYEILVKWFWEFPVAYKFELGNTCCIQLIYHTVYW